MLEKNQVKLIDNILNHIGFGCYVGIVSAFFVFPITSSGQFKVRFYSIDSLPISDLIVFDANKDELIGLTNEKGEITIPDFEIYAHLRNVENIDTFILILKDKTYFLKRSPKVLNEVVIRAEKNDAILLRLQNLLKYNSELYERNKDMRNVNKEYYNINYKISNPQSKGEMGYYGTIFYDPSHKSYSKLFYCNVDYFDHVAELEKNSFHEVGNRSWQIGVTNALDKESYLIKRISRGKLKELSQTENDSSIIFRFIIQDKLQPNNYVTLILGRDNIVKSIIFNMPRVKTLLRINSTWVSYYVEFRYIFDSIIRLKEIKIFDCQNYNGQDFNHLIKAQRNNSISSCKVKGKVTTLSFAEERKYNLKNYP